MPATAFTHVHVDLVGPLPPLRGFSYLLTCVDQMTRWPEAMPLSSITAESCANAFLCDWVARFGVPHDISSDRGRQFNFALWASLRPPSE